MLPREDPLSGSGRDERDADWEPDENGSTELNPPGATCLLDADDAAPYRVTG